MIYKCDACGRYTWWDLETIEDNIGHYESRSCANCFRLDEIAHFTWKEMRDTLASSRKRFAIPPQTVDYLPLNIETLPPRYYQDTLGVAYSDCSLCKSFTKHLLIQTRTFFRGSVVKECSRCKHHQYVMSQAWGE